MSETSYKPLGAAADVPGSRIYSRKGSKSLYIAFRRADGTRIRRPAGTADLTEASQILLREYNRANDIHFIEAVAEFFTVHGKTLKPTTLHGYRNSLRVLDPFFGKMTLSEITVEDLKRFVSSRRQAVTDASVRRDLMFLSSVFSYAQEAIPNAPEVNPVIQLKKKKLKETRRERFLSHGEFKRLHNACLLEWQKVVVTTAVLSGLRHSELRNLRMEHVLFHKREIQLTGDMTKNGKPRVIPLLPELADTLQDWCVRQTGEWVFGRYVRAKRTHLPYTSFQGFFKGACTRAQLENLRIHDLRHTFASWWMQEGGDIYVLKDILGHSSMQMVERYAHLDTGRAHRAIGDFPEHNFGTLGKVD